MKDLNQKYKFWNVKKRQMYGPYTLQELIVQKNANICIDDCKVLQYTGKTDRNGQEIYYGDTLLIEEDDEEKPIVDTVKWIDIGWSVNDGWLSDYSDWSLIVGNAFEPRKRGER